MHFAHDYLGSGRCSLGCTFCRDLSSVQVDMSTCSIEFVFFGPISAFGHRTALAGSRILHYPANFQPIRSCQTGSQEQRPRAALPGQNVVIGSCRIPRANFQFLVSIMKTSSHLDVFQILECKTSIVEIFDFVFLLTGYRGGSANYV